MSDFTESKDGYLMPKLDASFDVHAARIFRDAMADYDGLSRCLKSLLENIAICQKHAMSSAADGSAK